MKKLSFISLIMIAALVLTACGTQTITEAPIAQEPAQVEPQPVVEEEAMLPSIAEIAVEDGRFNTLVAALGAADLVDTLSSEGAFTVFAPTDNAFAALPEGTVEALLDDIPTLTDILLYHVLDGAVFAETVLTLDGQQVEALSGDTLMISVGDDVMVNTSKVVITDIEASNGVIHVIDTVLLPPADMQEEAMLPSIAEIAVEDGRFNTLVAALGAADLVDTLSSEGAFTVFAPTDNAFAALPEGTVEALLDDIPTLTDILLYHVLDGAVFAETVLTLDGQQVEALSGDTLMISVGDDVMVNTSKVVITDIEASNGVIHVIDTVLLPPADEGASLKTITEIAIQDGRFNTLVTALEAAGLAETLATAGSYTVFAPTDTAFAALPEGTIEALLADIAALEDVLKNHLVYGIGTEAFLSSIEGQPISATSGLLLDITSTTTGLQVNGIDIVITNIEAINGVIHVIDAVLLASN